MTARPSPAHPDPARALPPEVAAGLPDTAYVLDPRVAVARYAHLAGQLRASAAGGPCWYAVKCNPHPALLGALRDAGCGFEVASLAELEAVRHVGVRTGDVPFSNPIRSIDTSTAALDAGVRLFVVDSFAELHRLTQARARSGVPRGDAGILVRVDTPAGNADWDLSGKFGVPADEACLLVDAALAAGLDVAGVSFHVGSQARASAWPAAIPSAASVLAHAQQRGARAQFVDIGGGLPVSYHDPSTAWDNEAAATIVQAALAEIADFPALAGAQVALEPGRFIAAPAGRFRTTILGSAARAGSGKWAYADVGTYNGLPEAREWRGVVSFPVVPAASRTAAAPRTGAMVATTVTGPTCDAADVVAASVMLPADLPDGSVLEYLYAGAYAHVSASSFNGFPPPHVWVLADDGPRPWPAPLPGAVAG